MEKKDSLYELTTKANGLISTIIQAGGVITEEMETYLTDLNTAIATKIDGYHFILQRLELEEQFWKSEAKARDKIAKSCNNAIERLYDRLMVTMQANGLSSIQGESTKATLVTTKGRLVITDESLIPMTFKKQIIEYELDKDALRSALENMEVVPGAEIQGGASVRLTTTKKEVTNE